MAMNPQRLDEQLFKLLSKREKTAHKGHFGHVLIIGGDDGYAGATRLAGEAALRVGAGLVSIATQPTHVNAVMAGRPELMVRGIEQGTDLSPLLKRATVVVIGPGLGRSVWSEEIFTYILQVITVPMIIDGDGLYWLSQRPHQNAQWILTPHVQEASRLLKISTEAIDNNRLAAVTQLQQQYKGVSVLKGSGTLVQDEHATHICLAGNPGMATGGMGDVLSGVIGGLLAQGLSLKEVAQLGVFMHACAGDLAAQHGERGLIASDLLQYIRQLANA